MKLFLYSSYLLADAHLRALEALTGKDPAAIRFAVIANAVDVFEEAEAWIDSSLDALRVHGAQVDNIDLRVWRDDREGLRQTLSDYDIIWVNGGHTFYLRWMLQVSGADAIISALVQAGTVYAGWSAGAIVAGPTLHYFELFDDLKDAPEVIWDGLAMTDLVVLPHMDLPDFADGMREIDQQLQRDGFRTVPLREDQALVIDSDTWQVI